MDFRFTDEQQELARLAERVAQAVAARSGGGLDLAPLLESGLLGLTVPEAHGGGGATMVEAAILAEQLGRHLAPAAAMSSALLMPAALELVAAEDVRAALTADLLSGRPGCVTVGPRLSWPPTGDGLVYAWHPDAFVLVPAPGGLAPWAGGPLAPHPTQDFGLTVAQIPTQALDADVAVSPAARRFAITANVVAACTLVGHMGATLDRAVGYASQREQFGTKIGSFQAVKHMCADMFVDLESSRSAAYGAAAIVAGTDDLDDAERSAAVAKAWCGEAGVRTCETSIQVHGGIGFTWECDVHHYLRAAHLMNASFMSVDDALDLVKVG